MVCANGKPNSHWKFPFGVGVYHLNNRLNLPNSFFKAAAEIVVLKEITDASIDEELLLDYEEDGELHLISATAAFMKRNLKRIVGFCEVVVPSYAIDEFRSHCRMAKTTFEVLAQQLAVTQEQSPQEIVLAENQFMYRSRFHLFGSSHNSKIGKQNSQQQLC